MLLPLSKHTQTKELNRVQGQKQNQTMSEHNHLPQVIRAWEQQCQPGTPRQCALEPAFPCTGRRPCSQDTQDRGTQEEAVSPQSLPSTGKPGAQGDSQSLTSDEWRHGYHGANSDLSPGRNLLGRLATAGGRGL